MSAIATERRVTEDLSRPRTRTRTERHHRSVRRARARTATPVRAKAQATSIPSGVLLWAFIAFLAFAGSSLVAQTTLESARRRSIWAAENANDVRNEVTLLRQEVSRLSSLGTVDRWARARGYVSSAKAFGPKLTPKPEMGSVASLR